MSSGNYLSNDGVWFSQESCCDGNAYQAGAAMKSAWQNAAGGDDEAAVLFIASHFWRRSKESANCFGCHLFAPEMTHVCLIVKGIQLYSARTPLQAHIQWYSSSYCALSIASTYLSICLSDHRAQVIMQAWLCHSCNQSPGVFPEWKSNVSLSEGEIYQPLQVCEATTTSPLLSEPHLKKADFSLLLSLPGPEQKSLCLEAADPATETDLWELSFYSLFFLKLTYFLNLLVCSFVSLSKETGPWNSALHKLIRL